MKNRGTVVSRQHKGDTNKLILSLIKNENDPEGANVFEEVYERLNYIEALASELATMSREMDQGLLGYFFMMAADEARLAQLRLNRTS